MEPTDTLSVLIIGVNTKFGSAFAHNMQALIVHLKQDEMTIISVDTFEGLKDGFIGNGAMADCVLIDWHAQSSKELIKLIREQNTHVSIFLLTEPGAPSPSSRLKCSPPSRRVRLDPWRHTRVYRRKNKIRSP